MSDATSSQPFAVVMRGYDREQVNNYFKRTDADLRVLAADRDAAAANARELASHLVEAREEIESLRREVDRLAVPPTTAQGMSERISRMLQLASDETSEMRAQAEAESAELLSLARQDAAAAREEADQDAADTRAAANADAERIRSEAAEYDRETRERVDTMVRDTEKRRTAMEAEHVSTMDAAKAECERIIAAAHAEAEELALRADQSRERAQNDFEVSMAARREKLVSEMEHLEATTREEARQHLEVTHANADRLRQHAQSVATERVIRAKESVEQVRLLRMRMLSAISEIREELAEVPDLLSDTEADAKLLEVDPLDLLNEGLSEDSRIPTARDAAGSSAKPSANGSPVTGSPVAGRPDTTDMDSGATTSGSANPNSADGAGADKAGVNGKTVNGTHTNGAHPNGSARSAVNGTAAHNGTNVQSSSDAGGDDSKASPNGQGPSGPVSTRNRRQSPTPSGRR